MPLLPTLFGDPNRREIKRHRAVVERINALEPEYQALSDEQLRAKTAEFRERLGVEGTDFSFGQTHGSLLGDHDEDAEEARLEEEHDRAEWQRRLEEILPEAFAAVREAARRHLGMRPYDVQLIGGIVLHQGKIAEMRTGEGKTLVATLPLYLNALEARGAHLVTVNDYLVRRDAGWNGPLYHALGVSVAVIVPDDQFMFDPDFLDETHPDPRLQHLRPCTRREAYAADITYTTNNELGFDYLRDNMAPSLELCVQRRLHYAIVDEVDSILVDEARTPLIISGQAAEPTEKYYTYARLIPRLVEEEDYTVDEKTRSAALTEPGVEKIEKWTGIQNVYDMEHVAEAHQINKALLAHALYKNDQNYIVRDGEVIIVDEFTGRTMPGRRWSDGLHQAVEAKEGVKVQQEQLTLATITFQNFFRMYTKLAGMTGTALTEAEEFHKIYKLDVVAIPTHRPTVRKDEPDLIFKSEQAKFTALVEEVKDRHQAGQPILVGTTSIEKSEQISRLLEKQGVPHHVLNAKHHEHEAQIVTDAGQRGTVTIATNMAGRGTDIVLGDDVAALGGLYIIGTDRHESRRIDNQLRGRAGRQGDPGETRFYLSFEDDLMRVFGGDRMQGILDRFGLEDDQPLESKLVSRQIEGAQSRVEGHNFDARRYIVEYDDVVNRQREIIYAERRKILEGADTRNNIQHMIEALVRDEVPKHCEGRSREGWDLDGLWERMRQFAPLPETDSVDLDTLGASIEEITETLTGEIMEIYESRERELGEEYFRNVERQVMLMAIDQRWQSYLTDIQHVQEGARLQAHAQVDPLVEFKSRAFDAFQELTEGIQQEVVRTLLNEGTLQSLKQQRERLAEAARAQQDAVRREAEGAAATETETAAGSSNGQQPSNGATQHSASVAPAARPAAAAASTALARAAGGAMGLPVRGTAVRNVTESAGGTTRRVAAPVGVVAGEERLLAAGKVGRNEPCPCGSGKKYKRCHGA